MTNQTLQSQINSDDMKNIIQQRQILSMIGLDIWVQRDTPTIDVDYDSLEDLESLDVIGFEGGSESDSYICAVEEGDIAESVDSPTLRNSAQDQSESGLSKVETEVQPVVATQQDSFSDGLADENSAQKASVKSKIDELKSQLNGTTAKNTPKNLPDAPSKEDIAQVKPRTHYEQVTPFELHGARFGEWVLMADGQSLKNEQTLMLWNNLLNSLSLSAEQLKFPICEGISDKESANASVAGFIFRLAKRDNAKLAVVTPLPEGIDHDRVIRVPYLEEMLQDSRQKKQLWQLLTEAS